jgi:hypothetical protein
MVFAVADGAGVQFRSVEAQVLDVRGKPAAHVEVFLRGLERDAMGINALDAGSESAPGWRFVTDSRGRFTARFGMFSSIEHESETHEVLPGWGTFYFVATQPGTAGAVSPRMENYSGKANDWRPDRRERDEWSWGRTIRLRNGQTRVSMQFQSGLRVAGRVIDRRGHPVGGLEVSVTHDLHVRSHTGFGGEIFAHAAFSDAAGRFSFERVYPARFDLGLLSRKPEVFWVKTKVRRQWSGERVDEIAPRAGERSIAVEIVAAREIPYRYFGRVTDGAKKPVSGAKVVIGVSLHRTPGTFGDEHTFLDGQTDEDGRYEIAATSPFARFIRAEAPGFKDAERDFEERGHLAPPGEYDLALKPVGTADAAAKK